MAGAADFLPPFSFCAAIISCLLRSASSRAFFFSRASASFFSDSSFLSFSSSALFLLGELFLLLNSDFLPLSLFLLQSLEFLFFLTPFFSPLVNVLFQLIIQLALLGFIFGRSHDV